MVLDAGVKPLARTEAPNMSVAGESSPRNLLTAGLRPECGGTPGLDLQDTPIRREGELTEAS